MNGLEDKSPSDSRHSEIEESTKQKYVEMSPNKRYIRFEELISQTGNIKFSYKAFDTRNGTEVIWQKICMSDLSESEQERISRSANYLKEVQHQHIMEYLAIWLTEEPRTLNLITTYLDSLKQFIDKIATLRWRIVKKWCRHILRGLAYLHSSDPQIIHRNLTWNNIFVNPGLGDLYIGGMWLSGILTNSSDPISVSDALTEHYQGSAAYKAPEMESQPLTTKMDIYSFGMCVLVLIIRDEPYGDCRGDNQRIARRAARGIPPKELARIQSRKARDFISSCLRVNPEERLSAEQLLDHEFLQPDEELDDKEVAVGLVDSSPSDDVSDDDPDIFESESGDGGRLVKVSTPGISLGGIGNEESHGGSINVDIGNVPRIHANSVSDVSLNDAKVAVLSQRLDDSSLATAQLAEQTGTDAAVLLSPESCSVELRQNRLDMELAALSKGEDVHQDKGIHDGRRSDKDQFNEIADGRSADPSARVSKHLAKDLPPTFSAMSPCGMPTTIRAIPQSADAVTDVIPHATQEVAVQLRIAEGHTSDGIIKDVEFLFHIGQDNFDVVAAEMKQELNLILPTDQLATLIRLQVESIEGAQKEMWNAKLESTDSSSETTGAHDRLVTTSTATTDDNNVTEPINFQAVSQRSPDMHILAEGVVENVAMQLSSESDRPTIDGDQIAESASEIVGTVKEDLGIFLSEASQSAVDALKSTDVEHSNQQDVVESVSTTSLVSMDVNAVASGLDEAAIIIRPPGEDASPEEIIDYEEYLKENEKIDKECRAAKRVFEQRIQKHKIIQETCEEDLLKIQDDYINQCNQLDKSEAKAMRKKEEYLRQALMDFESKVQELRAARVESRAAQILLQQEKNRMHMIDSGALDHAEVHIPGGAYNAWSVQQSADMNSPKNGVS